MLGKVRRVRGAEQELQTRTLQTPHPKTRPWWIRRLSSKEVRVLVSECKFTNPEEHISDALIFGSNNARVQSKLLEYDSTLTLNKATSIARTQQATSTQLQDIRGSQTTTTDALKQYGRNPRHRDPITNNPLAQATHDAKCGNCVTFHNPPRRECPAYGTRCESCGKLRHWKSVCRSRPKTRTG